MYCLQEEPFYFVVSLWLYESANYSFWYCWDKNLLRSWNILFPNNWLLLSVSFWKAVFHFCVNWSHCIKHLIAVKLPPGSGFLIFFGRIDEISEKCLIFYNILSDFAHWIRFLNSGLRICGSGSPLRQKSCRFSFSRLLLRWRDFALPSTSLILLRLEVVGKTFALKIK